MPWSPDVYNQFKAERYQPFYDLISHIQPAPGMNMLDLGCGTGEQTKILADRFNANKVLGIDSSAEMLQQAPQQENLFFAQRSIEEQLSLPEKWDLIHANASLQWVNDHETLFPKLLAQLTPAGQLAVQIPSQKENILNQLLYELVHETPYYEILKDHIRHSPVLSLDHYTQLFYSNGAKQVLVYQKVYPIIAASTETLFAFISGSSLVPYMEKLEGPVSTEFVNTFKSRITHRFTATPIVYAFKRIILVAGC